MQPTNAMSGHMDETNKGLWDRYVANIRAQGVKPTAVRWYVIRAEQYLRTVAPKPLAEHTPQDVTAYLETLGRASNMTDWQYRQTVQAIQHLLEYRSYKWHCSAGPSEVQPPTTPDVYQQHSIVDGGWV